MDNINHLASQKKEVNRLLLQEAYLDCIKSDTLYPSEFVIQQHTFQETFFGTQPLLEEKDTKEIAKDIKEQLVTNLGEVTNQLYTHSNHSILDIENINLEYTIQP